ncbi:response regulator, partial [Pseudomonas protegens]|uniref:response regulator n=2 Tax=Pseudomonas TaxID=286 RepID=UPI000C9B4226
MNILLVDDHAVVRQGYASLLRAVLPAMQVREAASGEEALTRVAEEVPNLVIMDFGLPGISGLETTRRLRQRLPQLRVLFFSMHDELPLVRQALEAGASGYLTKNSAPQVLIEAVHRVLAGHAYIEQPLATQLACTPAQNASDPRLQSMTQRELEIFVMLAKGTPARVIAEQL